MLVTGFGNSGVTAVTDLLAEIDGVLCPPQEFFLIQHPDGLTALEDAIVHSWSEFGPDSAIRRFEHLVDVLARKSTRLRFGLDYERHFSKSFRRILDGYIARLTSVTYDGHLMFRRAEMPKAEYAMYEVARRFGVGAVNRYFARKYNTRFVSDPSKFLEETRRLTREMLEAIDAGRGSTDIALLLGTSPYQVARTAKYFDDPVTIVVDRDPRDIYLSAKTSSYMPREIGAFIRWFEATRDNAWQTGSERVLKLYFEDLVFDYDASVGKVLSFLGIDGSRHTKKKTRFKPESSAKRIGKWKNHPDQAEIDRVARELERHLWNEKA